MIEKELETSRKTILYPENVKRIDELEKWFRFDYPARLNKISRYSYLGLPLPETRYELEREAYDKENELRILNGEKPLPPLKLHNLL